MRTSLYLLVFLLIASCSDLSIENDEEEVVKKFYDLNAYFSGEIDQLSKQNINLVKDANLNEQSESITIDSVDFDAELQIFKDSDINKPAWWDQYRGDTTYHANQISEIKYERLNPDLTTERIFISFSTSQRPDSIVIVNRVERRIMTVRKQLTYVPGKYFSISNTEKLPLGEENKIFLKGTFVEK